MPDTTVHPPIPLGIGSYISLTGIAGAIASFLIAWGENGWHLTSPIAALGVTAGGAIVAWFHGRSKQAAALIDRVGFELGQVGVAVSDKPADGTQP